MDATVVVAVYNPGADVDDLLASLDAQTHPTDRWEVVFVDDGSTDGTGERLDAWCAQRPWASVEHIPNSGWPGRPRNVGTDIARGEFVLYVDNDDWLDPRAVELLVARARELDADVVVGKVVGHGKNVARELFRERRDDVDLSWRPLVKLLSPHKLFRRRLLTEHGIRFPEGRARLEDHVVVLSAFFAARRIAVLADHVVYHWMRRDAGNASLARMDAEAYFGTDVPRVLDVIDAHVPAGPERDRLYVHWLHTKALWRLQGRAYAQRDADHNAEIYAAVRRLVLERFPPRIDARLPFSVGVLAALVRADRPDAVLELARYEAGLRISLRANASEPQAGGSELVRLGGRFGGTRLRVRENGDRLEWVPPAPLDDLLSGLGLDLRLPEKTKPRAEVVLRAPDGVEHLLPATTRLHLAPVKDEPGLLAPVARMKVTLDRATAASGSPLPPGAWSLGTTLRLAGFGTTTFKVRPVEPDGTLGPAGPHVVTGG